MDYLKQGIGLRAMAQRDPVVEYHREGYDIFVAMLEGVKEECVGALFNAEIKAAPAPAPALAPAAASSVVAEFAPVATTAAPADAAQHDGGGHHATASR